MTPKQQREEISKAYVHAVAARCGFKVGTWTQDDDCLDVTLGAAGIVGQGVVASPKVDLQLKATNDPKHLLADGRVAWALKREHHETLIREAHTFKLLVVLILPQDETTWLTHSVNELILRRCAWWACMTGLPRDGGSTDHVTVHLPAHQVFSPEELRKIMERISKKERP